jgi:ribosomal protein L30E
MATKKELLDAAKGGKLIIGSRRVFKELRKGKLAMVLHATNCPQDAVNNIKKLSTISNIKIEGFKGNSRVLGEALGKPFNILLVGIRK